jgi:hypothetical protein
MKALNAYARRSVTLLAALGSIVSSSACFSYLEVPPGDLAPGTRVRAQLSTEGQVRLGDLLGAPQREVEGEVVEANPESLLLLARVGVSSTPTGVFLERQRLQIEQREIVRLEARRLERQKTVAFSALAAGALIGTAIWLFTAERSGTEIPEVPAPENAVLRWFFR